MPTVQEVLKQTGLSDEQITALDPKVITGVTTILSTAQQAEEKAANERRLQAQQYDTEIAPALDKWAQEQAVKDAQIAFYKTQLEGAKKGGFLPADAPLTAPATSDVGRDAGGKFVAGQNPVPGSPQFVADFRKEAGAAIGSMLDLTWKYTALYGKPMPDSPTTLIAEANAQRMDPISYAAKKYDFQGKESAIKAEEAKKFEDGIRKEEREKVTKEITEKLGSNPMLRQAESSRFSSIAAATKKGERPDTMNMTPEQRRDATRQSIHKEIAEHETVQ